MEEFNNFKSKDLEIRFPTSLELKEIKQMLLTGEREKILLSVEKIKIFLSSEESVSEILRSDILEFLCDAVLPSDSVVACSLYQCIEIMVNHLEFFTHNHSCFAIESLMRTLHFLIKDCDDFRGLNQCLNLLNLILQGYKFQNMTPEKKTIENLLQLLSVLKKLSPTINNKFQTGTLILNLIELNILKRCQEACDLILGSLSSWLILINEFLEYEHPMREKLILLCCTLSHLVLRYIFSNESIENECNLEINENLKNDIIRSIIEFLITVGVPYFEIGNTRGDRVLLVECNKRLVSSSFNYLQTVPLSKVENNPSHLENFYQAILCFYTEEITPEKSRLIHGLSETNFLQFTTKIIIFTGFSQGQKLRRLCILVLFYMILYLAEDVFHFPEVWPSGRDNFRCEVQRGIAELPLDATQWLNVLVSPHASFSSKLVLLLYLYFYSMTAKSQDILEALYPAVVSFIRFNTEIRSSVLLLKVVWFVFVMSQLSVAQTSSIENELEVTNEMVALLEAQQDLSLVYTHHPALLYWVFSSKVNSNIQTQTVYLWLRNKTPDCKELDELMKNSSDVRYAILDILQNGWGQELDSAFSSLKSLLLDSDTNDELAVGVWFLLPQVLAKFTADFTSVINVDYVIELCSLKAPKSLDITKVIRAASLLSEVFHKSDLISIIPSLSLVFRLLKLGHEMEDNRVLWVFLRHDGFIRKIVEGLNTSVSQIFVLSMKIMVVFWKDCQDMKNTEFKKIEINSQVILKVLNTNCDEILREGLNFLEVILINNFRSPIFEIGRMNNDFFENLFLEIQNTCIKTTLDNSKRCWRCLKLFLLMEPLDGELVTNPLLHELVIFNLPLLKESEELKEFLKVWMDFYNAKINDPCFGRKIFGKFYSETLTRINREMKEGEGEKQEDQKQRFQRKNQFP